MRQVKSGKASGDSKVPAEYLKALRGSTEGMALLMGAVEAFWLRDVTPEEFNSLRLKTLPKSGDLSNVGKWRGIYLMDIVCKVVSKVMERRLNSILLEHGMEAQNGFMGGRGTTDGTFLPTLASFVDPSVPTVTIARRAQNAWARPGARARTQDAKARRTTFYF